MSDKYYAVQFRSMHTAIHNVIVFSVESTADELFNILNETNEMPEFFQEFDNDKNFCDMFEIDYRNPPTHWPHIDDENALELIYVNIPVNNIPDVYGC